jgi:AdoMet-dependent heme synthase
MPERLDTQFDRVPMMIYWELTRSCDLACRHCRAEAVAWRNPHELTTDQGFRLLEQLAEFSEPGAMTPHLVLTGGDPLKRPDVYTFAEHGRQLGLPVSITPSGTPLLTGEAMAKLRDAGIHTLALSLDGSTPERHDRIRQVDGSFARTVEAAGWARELGFSLQINSLVCEETATDLPAVYELAKRLDADRWSVFFLVTVGRGSVLGQVTPDQCEQILEWLYEQTLVSQRPAIKTTEAHHFRRIALQRQKRAAQVAPQHSMSGAASSTRPLSTNGHVPAPTAGLRRPDNRPGTGEAPPGHRSGSASSIRRGFGIRDGAGIMFISHTGEVYPSGFLPICAGNVKTDHPVRIYREAPLFVRLRDTSLLQGKCGACEYKAVCGGARSRAYAASGDPMGPDPLCVYQPPHHAPVSPMESV